MMNVRLWGTILALSAGLSMSAAQGATDYTFQGNFADDDDVVQISFSVAAPSTVTVFSSSWLYGNPPAGSGPGGFDPMLGIWTAGGSLINFQDDGGNVGSTSVNGTPYSHGTWDSYYVVNLAAGNYIATVTQYNNFNVSGVLTGGFIHDGNPNFTFDNGWGTQATFNGVWDIPDDPRTSFWRFHLLNVETASVNVPEPGTLALLGLGLAGIGAVRRKRLAA